MHVLTSFQISGCVVPSITYSMRISGKSFGEKICYFLFSRVQQSCDILMMSGANSADLLNGIISIKVYFVFALRHVRRVFLLNEGFGMMKKIKTVLITGGTSGIGLALAKKFAAEGNFLVLVSSNEQRLEETKRLLEKMKSDISVETICQDLSVEKAAEQVYRKVREKGISIDILVNNAGFGMVGEAVLADREKEEAMLRINVQTMTQLCALFLNDMYRDKSGKILNVASVGAWTPGPYTAAYYASKAYVSSYSRAIRVEAAKHGVQVCTLYPGTTRTEFFKKVGAKTPVWAMSPEKVADVAYHGLRKNKEMIIPGFLNKCLYIIPTKLKLMGVVFLKK